MDAASQAGTIHKITGIDAAVTGPCMAIRTACRAAYAGSEDAPMS
jgi:hypothetical protein